MCSNYVFNSSVVRLITTSRKVQGPVLQHSQLHFREIFQECFTVIFSWRETYISMSGKNREEKIPSCLFAASEHLRNQNVSLAPRKNPIHAHLFKKRRLKTSAGRVPSYYCSLLLRGLRLAKFHPGRFGTDPGESFKIIFFLPFCPSKRPPGPPRLLC